MARIDYTTMNAEAKKAIKNYAEKYEATLIAKQEYAKATKELRADIVRLTNDLTTKAHEASVAEAKRTALDLDRKELAEYEANYEAKIAEIGKIQAEACALFDKELYKAYVGRKANLSGYRLALETWLKSVGVKPTDGGVSFLTTLAGDKKVAVTKKGLSTCGVSALSYEDFALVMIANFALAMGFAKAEAKKSGK